MFELFLKALIVHLVVDWFMQSDWISENKTDLNHFAAWVHSGLHMAGYLLLFPIPVAMALGFSHLFIDTRRPLAWFRKEVASQNPQGAVLPVFEIWQDQAAHIVLLAIAVLYVGQ